jgi:hypothetical protein
MKEYTIYASERNGNVGGIAFNFPPTQREKQTALDWHSFTHADTRIFVLVVAGSVTLEQQRELAMALYFERGETHHFDDIRTYKPQAFAFSPAGAS